MVVYALKSTEIVLFLDLKIDIMIMINCYYYYCDARNTKVTSDNSLN